MYTLMFQWTILTRFGVKIKGIFSTCLKNFKNDYNLDLYDKPRTYKRKNKNISSYFPYTPAKFRQLYF
jgi:hypothetical protein